MYEFLIMYFRLQNKTIAISFRCPGKINHNFKSSDKCMNFLSCIFAYRTKQLQSLFGVDIKNHKTC